MGRDLLAVISNLKWNELAFVGSPWEVRCEAPLPSLELPTLLGIVVQQLLFLPYLSASPIPLPFRVTHAVLAATFGALLDKWYRLKLAKPTLSGVRRTLEQEW